jgi:quercetin dioxygenase-like cupin family protein
MPSGAGEVAPSARVLGAAGAILAWLGWFAVSPALGFPTLATAAMLNRVLVPDSDPGVWVGWTTMIAVLAALIGLYGFATGRRFFRPGVVSGFVYGVAAWGVAGAVIMPLLGVISPAAPPPPVLPGHIPPLNTPDPMHGTFMMLSLGPLAPASALIAWACFGVVLGSTFGARSAEAGSDARRIRGLRSRVARTPITLGVAALLLSGGGWIAATRGTAEQASNEGASRVLLRAEVPALPEGPMFLSIVELRQAAGATLGPHSHVAGFVYALAGETTTSFREPLQPGEAAFISAQVVHSHLNEQGRVPAGLLAGGLIVIAALLAVLAPWRAGRKAVTITLTAMLVAGGLIAVLNPWENDWLFIGIRPEPARGAPMPLPNAARIYESPRLPLDFNGRYNLEESLAMTTLDPQERARAAADPGPTVLLVLEGEAEVRSADGPPVPLGPKEATLVQRESYEVTNPGTAILRLLSFHIGHLSRGT